MNLEQTRDTINSFFDRASDHHKHLVDGHDAVIHANDDAWKIGVRKNGDGDLKCQISANQSQADNQKQNGAREALKPRYVWFDRRIRRTKGIGSWLHPRLLLVLFRGLRRISGFICFVALVGGNFFRSRGRFDLHLRVIRQRIAARTDHLIARDDTAYDL